MKEKIHPQYYPDAKITCACGNSFTVGSTVKEIPVEICSQCHPFYTGKQKLLDTARRVEKFQSRLSQKAEAAKERRGKKGKKIKAEIRKKKARKIKEEKATTDAK